MTTQTRHSALILHIDEQLDENRHRDLITAVNAKRGVSSVRTPKSGSRLLVVDYDPLATDWFEILTQVRRQSVAVQRVG
jgi:hypothetical protein